MITQIDGLVAITIQLNNLGREIKKLTEKVHTIHIGCKLSYGPYLSKDFPKKEDVKIMKEIYCGEFFGRSYPGPGMDETVENFMAESTKRHEETEVLIMEIPASTDVALRNQGASINTTETQVGEISKVIRVPSNDEEASRRYVLPKPKLVVEPYTPPIPFLIRLVEVKNVDQGKKYLSSLKKIVDQHPIVEALKKIPNKDLSGYCNEGNLVRVYHSSIVEIHMEKVDDAAQVNEDLAEDEDEAYEERKCNLLGIPYDPQPCILVDEVMRYTVGPGEQPLTIKTSEYEELPRSKGNITGIIVGLVQEMVEGVCVEIFLEISFYYFQK
nr:hypothetical protein [Tanacetum cinerariifolium]